MQSHMVRVVHIGNKKMTVLGKYGVSSGQNQQAGVTARGTARVFRRVGCFGSDETVGIFPVCGRVCHLWQAQVAPLQAYFTA